MCHRSPSRFKRSLFLRRGALPLPISSRLPPPRSPTGRLLRPRRRLATSEVHTENTVTPARSSFSCECTHIRGPVHGCVHGEFVRLPTVKHDGVTSFHCTILSKVHVNRKVLTKLKWIWFRYSRTDERFLCRLQALSFAEEFPRDCR